MSHAASYGEINPVISYINPAIKNINRHAGEEIVSQFHFRHSVQAERGLSRARLGNTESRDFIPFGQTS